MLAPHEVNPANVKAALLDAAANLPEDGRPDSQSWGQSWAHALVASATDPDLRRAIGETFDELLRSRREPLIRLAANSYPERVGCGEAIADAVAIADTLRAETAEALYSALGRAIEAGTVAWRPEYRELLRPDRRSPLLYGAFMADRDWFAQHLERVFGGTPSQAATAAWFLAESLDQPQRSELRSLVEAHRAELRPASVTKILAQLDA
jgi:hypothetical protein